MPTLRNMISLLIISAVVSLLSLTLTEVPTMPLKTTTKNVPAWMRQVGGGGKNTGLGGAGNVRPPMPTANRPKRPADNRVRGGQKGSEFTGLGGAVEPAMPSWMRDMMVGVNTGIDTAGDVATNIPVWLRALFGGAGLGGADKPQMMLGGAPKMPEDTMPKGSGFGSSYGGNWGRRGGGWGSGGNYSPWQSWLMGLNSWNI